MKPILFITFFRIKNFFLSHKKGEVLLSNISLLLFVGIYFVGFYFALGAVELYSDIPINTIKKTGALVLFSIPIIFLFIPNYLGKTIFFKPTDPVGYIQKFFTELIFQTFSFVYILIIFSLLILRFISPYFTEYDLILSLLFFIISHIFCIIIHNILLLKSKKAIMLVAFIITFLGFAVGIYFSSYEYLLAFAGSIPFLVFVNYYLEIQEKNIYINSKTKTQSYGNLIIILATAYFKKRVIVINLFLIMFFMIRIWYWIYVKYIIKNISDQKSDRSV